MAARKRGSTSTSDFGVSKREGHDARAFYSRFELPEVSTDATVNPPGARDKIFVGPSSDMSAVADNSIALVVTSPPYYAGKAYELDIGEGHIPASYLDYLEMLTDVFRECVRVLEPGGRIAVNVANLGRKPYRSLSADVTHILQDRLKLLLRGEVIWLKARGAGGNCAWGSFQQPTNPVLRDLSERIIIASKGRFDRAVSKDDRAANGLPSVSTIARDEFLDFTTDVWEFAPESASRIGHPAPFPIELPARLIDLYTYEGDIVLDPFMGSGTTAVAAIQSKRHYLGFDTDAGYVKLTNERIKKAKAEQRAREKSGDALRPSLPAKAEAAPPPTPEELGRHAVLSGMKANDYAHSLLEHAGFTKIRRKPKIVGGTEISFEADDAAGATWRFEVVGAFTSSKPGLNRTENLWRTIGKATLAQAYDAALGESSPFVVLTTVAPPRGSAGAKALNAVIGHDAPIRDVITLLDADNLDRLREMCGTSPASQ